MEERSHSLAVTASELARVQSINGNRESHGLSPDTSIDFARIPEEPRVETYHTYVLRQSSYNTQSLISTAESGPTSYSIKHHTTGGFMKKQPHLVITRDTEGRITRVAEAWYDTHGYGSKIVYTDVGATQHLAREDPDQRRFTCSIDGVTNTWQPLGPSRNVMELTNETGRRAALFVYAETVCQRSVSYSGGPLNFRGVEVGRLHIMDHVIGKQEVLEQICCTAVIIVEKMKQKVKILGNSN